jgi:hypothetical protein
MHVGTWLQRIGLSQYEQAFAEHAIDASILAKLTEQDLKDLGVILIGHRRKLLDAIAALPGLATSTAAPAESLVTQGVPAGIMLSMATAERRQLTIMFYDLVGSTALSTKIDPEELRKLLSAYHRSVTGVLAGFDGFVARYGRWWAGLFRLSAGA